MPQPSGRKLGDVLWGAVLGFSLCLNLALGFALWDRFHSPAGPGQPASVPEVGAEIPSLTLITSAGTEKSLNYAADRRPTVLYVFSPACGWCRRNTANIRELAEGLSERFRFIGLTLSYDGLDEYLIQHPLGLEVAGAVSPDALRALGFAGTPFTAVVSPQGRLVAAWRGAYGGPVEEEINDFFGMKLPGLSD